ncbi:MAG TPA: 4-hydroxy-tetrahydrodipicolinate synthase [Treponemataceae bacterium]|nr:4-hydroxy-tetrahydrodipicolinate synthase [Treponemataceae bacterium]
MAILQGTFTALVSPMFGDGSIDYEGFRKLVQKQLNAGVAGLVPLGTTAETPTLEEHDEEEKLIRIVVEEVKHAKKNSKRDISVILGAGSNNTRDAVYYVERAKKNGADYALVVTPYYNKPSPEGIYRHFEEVSKVGIPIIVYNIQGRTGTNISTDVLKRIAQLPTIAGVKEASGNIGQMMDVIAEIKMSNPDFAVLSGDDSLTLPLMAAGGDGVISVVSNFIPELMVDLTNCIRNNDFEKARKIHYRLLPFFKAAFCDGNPSSIKYAMKVKGLISDSVRLPLVRVNDEAKKIIEKALKDCNL